MSDKRGLVRIVRTPTGEIVIDPPARANGRGAYLCRSKPCWTEALQRKRIGSALRVNLSPEDVARIESFVEGLPDEDVGPEPSPDA